MVIVIINQNNLECSHFPHFNSDKIITNMIKSPKWPQNKYFGMTRGQINYGGKWKKASGADKNAL